MPSTTSKQKFFMRIAAHDPEFAKKNDIDIKVAKDFYKADKKKEEDKKKKDKVKK